MKLGLLGLLVFVVTACGSTPTQPTAASLPPTSAALTAVIIDPSPTTATSAHVWKQQTVGKQNVTVTFYDNSSGAACVRYDLAAGGPVEKCATANNLVAVQGTTTDSDGTIYTIVAGRILSDKITAVSLEMANGSNTSVPADDGGFLTVSPGQSKFARAVPIDQYGNLVGRIFTFG